MLYKQLLYKLGVSIENAEGLTGKGDSQMRVAIGLLIWNIGVWIAGIGNKIADSGYTPPEDEGVTPQECALRAFSSLGSAQTAQWGVSSAAVEELEFDSDHIATAA